MVRLRVDLRDLQKAMQDVSSIKRWMQLEVPVETHEHAEEAAWYAREIAPVHSTALIQAIDVRRNKKGESFVVSRTPKKNNPRKRPYHLMMAGKITPNISRHIYSGDPYYMDTTANKFGKDYFDTLKKELEKTLSKK